MKVANMVSLYDRSRVNNCLCTPMTFHLIPGPLLQSTFLVRSATYMPEPGDRRLYNYMKGKERLAGLEQKCGLDRGAEDWVENC